MKRSPCIGLLPLYLKLYDDTGPERREGFAPFLATVKEGFTRRGVEVKEAPICRIASEFDQAIRTFEGQGVDCVVTLHLAYSPSLEAIVPLTKSELPILMLDTTMDATFGRDVDPARIMYNHGIHGVMDLASVLRRCDRDFRIVAGHVTESDVLDRAAGIARAAYGARSLRETKALRIGESFKGMGDFYVEHHVLGRVLGITADQVELDALAAAAAGVSDEDVKQEMAQDRENFICTCPADVHERSVRVGLGVRQLLTQGGCSAFSMNFLAFDQAEGPASAVPFLEASKAMARGVGYAGEGDVLTAALVGALQRAFGQTTFTEIFCPDWQGDSLFLSHMGEINPEVAADKPTLIEKPFPYTPAQNPAVLTCAPRTGPAVFVNLVPGAEDSFHLVVAPVQVLGDATNEALKDSVRGWIRPARPIGEFLEAYSEWGGTHHSALMLGEETEAITAFAAYAGMQCCVID